LWRTQFGSFPVGSFVPEFRVGNAIRCPALEPLDLSGPSVLLAIVLGFFTPQYHQLNLLDCCQKKKFLAFRVLKMRLIVVFQSLRVRLCCAGFLDFSQTTIILDSCFFRHEINFGSLW